MRFSTRTTLVLACISALIVGLGLATSGGSAEAHATTNAIGFSFDVAEDGSRFVFDETPLHGDGLPAYGGEFITQGYLYPAGTLTESGGTWNGVNPDGSPEFPDLVVGTWTCYGTHVGDGAHTLTGPWVISTQMYDIGNEAGDVSIVTAGIELSDFNVPFQRAITGTTGLRSALSGSEQTQEFLGFNESLGVTLRVSFSR